MVCPDQYIKRTYAKAPTDLYRKSDKHYLRSCVVHIILIIMVIMIIVIISIVIIVMLPIQATAGKPSAPRPTA